MKFSNSRQVATGILYRFNNVSLGDVEKIKGTGDLKLRIDDLGVSKRRSGVAMIQVNVSAHMQVSEFILELQCIVAFDIEDVEADELLDSEKKQLEVRNQIGYDLLKDPVHKLLTEILKLTPTRVE